MVMSQNQTAGQSHSIKIYNSSFERGGRVQIFGTLANQNSIQEGNHSTLQSGNACCHLVKNLLSSILLPNTTKIKIQRPVILSIFYMAVKIGLSHSRRNTC